LACLKCKIYLIMQYLENTARWRRHFSFVAFGTTCLWLDGVSEKSKRAP
jgi:hypothetical protein